MRTHTDGIEEVTGTGGSDPIVGNHGRNRSQEQDNPESSQPLDLLHVCGLQHDKAVTGAKLAPGFRSLGRNCVD
jgi:hypothetical protein